jgi:hypothetical protein
MVVMMVVVGGGGGVRACGRGGWTKKGLLRKFAVRLLETEGLCVEFYMHFISSIVDPLPKTYPKYIQQTNIKRNEGTLLIDATESGNI